MQPDALHAHLEDRLFAAAERGADPWRVGAGLLAGRLGAEPALMAEAVWDGWAWGRAAVFAQVGPSARDPRRFEVGGPRAGAGGETPSTASRSPSPSGGGSGVAPAVILPAGCEAEAACGGGADLVAFSLRAGCGWRMLRWTCACAFLGEIAPDAGGVVRLWQDPHAWLKRHLTAAAWRRRARARRVAAMDAARARGAEGGTGDLGAQLAAGDAAEAQGAVEQRGPDGALVLDPAAIPWTRAGVLAHAETIEIVDAPAGGPLGRALVAINPRLGTARGVALRGVEAARPAGRHERRRAA